MKTQKKKEKNRNKNINANDNFTWCRNFFFFLREIRLEKSNTNKP